MNRTSVTPRAVILMLLFVVLVPFLPLIISGRWDWWEAWVYAIFNVLAFAASRWLAARRHPDLLAERARFLQHKDAVSWDKRLAPLVGLGGGLIPLVAGLEARFDTSPDFSLQLKILAMIVIFLGFVLASFALIENRFFSGMVRLQTDRSQQVVSTGPYRWVRHPGYAGSIWAYLATPFLLDSPWAFLPAVLLVLILVVRTRLEDLFLHANLAGYNDYARQTKYRLLPGIW